MRIIPVLFVLLSAASFCYGAVKTVEVIGTGECADCEQNNIKHSNALRGLKVTIDCNQANGEVKTRGTGKLDEQGKFRVEFPKELVDEQTGKLKEECYAQLHGASGTPCAAYNGIQSSKLAFVSQTHKKHTFSPVEKVKFSSQTCASEFFLPYPPKLPKIVHFFHKKSFPPVWKKPSPSIPKFKKHFLPPFPKIKKPYPPIFKKPLLPPVPVYEKPIPPPVSIYKKPLPPPVPVYLPPPVYTKPLPPPLPVYKKPLPPPFPEKPYPLIFKKKPLPPLPKLPPFPFPKKKPCPPIPKLPFPKFPEHPKLPSFPSSSAHP